MENTQERTGKNCSRTARETWQSSRHLAILQIPQIPIWSSIRAMCWNKSSTSLVISVKWDPHEQPGSRYSNRMLHCGNKVINFIHLTGQLRTMWQQRMVTPEETSEAATTVCCSCRESCWGDSHGSHDQFQMVVADKSLQLEPLCRWGLILSLLRHSGETSRLRGEMLMIQRHLLLVGSRHDFGSMSK